MRASFRGGRGDRVVLVGHAFDGRLDPFDLNRVKIEILNFGLTIKPVAFSEINTDEFRRNSEIDLIARIKAYITEFCVKAADEVPACAKGSCITQGQAHTA